MSRFAKPLAARDPQQGVVLINVLVILALTSTVVFSMVSLSDISIARSQRFSEAAQAQALIAAGEASAIVTLRRDMTAADPSDSLNDGWAKIAQKPAEIAGGSFALQISDAQGRFNLRNLRGGGIADQQMLQRILSTLGLPADAAARITARLAQPSPPERVADVARDAGLPAAAAAAFADLVTILPERTDININTAPFPVLAALCENPVQARTLDRLRTQRGALTPNDLRAAKLVLLPGAGFSSRYFDVTVAVTIAGTQQSSHSLLYRQTGLGGQPDVIAIRRETPAGFLPPA